MVLFPLSSKAQGFTLIEMLIALAIMAVITTAVYDTFFIAERSIYETEQGTENLARARKILDSLKREIEAAYFDPVNDPSSVFQLQDRDQYKLESSRILLSTLSNSGPGPCVILYRLEKSENESILVKEFYSLEGQKGRRVCNSGIESFAVEVLCQDKWIRTWDASMDGPPTDVRISIGVKFGNRISKLSATAVLRLRNNA